MNTNRLVQSLALQTMQIIDYALRIYNEHRDMWDGIVQRAMASKLDWDQSSDEYLRVFESLLY